jgi:hypothetical protein
MWLGKVSATTAEEFAEVLKAAVPDEDRQGLHARALGTADEDKESLVANENRRCVLTCTHEPYESPDHPVPINATIVHALTLLHPAVPQPDGGRMYRCLTEFPGRAPLDAWSRYRP